jgi:hypothetical protein
MGKLFVLAITAVTAFVVVGGAMADTPAPTTFVAVLNADEEVPHCAAADNSSRGLAIFHVVNEMTGTVEFKLIANNIPGSTTAAHIHLAPKGVAGGVVQSLELTPGEEQGVVKEGTFTNPALVAAMQANPQAYYVNVHSTVCGAGVIRGQLGTHGAPGTTE